MSNENTPKQKPEDAIHATLVKKRTLSDKALEFLGDRVFKFPQRKPKEQVIAKLTPEQKQQLQEIEENAVAAFTGQLDELESALGMLRMGHHLGWRVLYIIHSKQTIRKYEDILGIKIRDIFPEKGPSSYRSYGLQFAEMCSNFWKAAGGDIKIPDRRTMGYEDQ